ncbi:AMP-binding protein [Ferrovibrio terrae]|uniref:class I adenylate-forming enzyme family protein n=1 Tax=Ferrovibrio terrae TaxID=2594003 RepID=UPI003137CAD7
MTLDRIIDRHAAFQPAQPALADERLSLTYGELAGRIDRMAGGLSGLGVTAGKRVAHLGYNAADIVVLLFACARLGAILVPLNWRLATPELVYALQDCGADLLIHDAAFGDTAAAICTEAGLQHRLVLDGAAGTAMALETMLAGAPALPASGNTEDGLEQPLLIVYTSGTTGRPKGAVLTQAALLANAQMSRHAFDLRSTDHVLTCLPMFHVGGLNIQTTPALLSGARVTLQSRFHPGRFIEAVERLRPDLSVLVPATIRALLDDPAYMGADLTALRAVGVGSSVVPPQLIAALEARGIPVLQIYGATETCPLAVYETMAMRGACPGTTGRPGLLCDIRIVDNTGVDVAPGIAGEIWVKGPQVLSQYWNAPDATAAALVDGWFRTGDIAMRDADWNVVVHDRKKNVIISGGENIYPAELERVLEEDNRIREAAVVARRDPRWDEIPVAVVVLAEGAVLQREDVLALFDGVVARYKLPRDVVFVSSLPRNAMGKVQHHILRELVAADRQSAA